jgi:hypothetical protein
MSNIDYLIFMSPTVGTILIVFGMKYYAAIRQARATVLTEDAYRTLAEKATTAQADSAVRLADISARLMSVEKMLKEVG